MEVSRAHQVDSPPKGGGGWGNDRGGQVIFLAYCILDQNARASGIAKEEGSIVEVLEVLLHCGVGIIQMPCPELLYLGLGRPTHDKEWYDREDFRGLCKMLAEATISLLARYITGGYRVLGIVGIEHSPSCAVETIPITINGEKTYREGQGIFVEELSKALAKKKLERLPFKGLLLNKEGIKSLCNWLEARVKDL